MSSISHSIDTIVSSAGIVPDLADQKTEHIRMLGKVLVARAISDLVHPHLRQRAEARRVLRDQQGAGGRHQLGRDAAAHRSARPSAARRCRRGHRQHAVRAPHRSAADVDRRGHDVVGAEPLHAKDGADDVDDRVEGADLVQVHSIDRHLVDRGLRFGQPLEQRAARAPCPRPTAPTDRCSRRSRSGCDGEAMMRRTGAAIVRVVTCPCSWP